ncbi:UNVERIFIED_CONTAM: hypothetical protein HDU68_004037, partial [Siphonaria sp. JEL0065]
IWTGRPLAIHDSDWDAEYPEATTPEMTTLRHHIDLAIIIAKILRFANRAQPTDANTFALTIKASLDAWWSALDDDWRSVKFQERWNSKALMALMYHSATILFYRTAYCRIDQPACLEAANAITKLVSRFEAPPSTNECIVLFPSFTYCAMMACTVHISQMLTSSANGNTRRFVDVVGNLEKCMRVFDNLRGVFITAERCWKTVLDFLTAKGINLDELVKAAKASAETIQGDASAPETPKVSQMGMNSVSTAPLVHAVDNMDISWPQSFMDATSASGSLNATTCVDDMSGLQQLNLTQKMQLQQLGMASSNIGGLRSGTGLWDGLSFFDLAGLGGLGGLTDTDFSLFQPPSSTMPANPPPQHQQQFQQQQQAGASTNSSISSSYQKPSGSQYPTPTRHQQSKPSSHAPTPKSLVSSGVGGTSRMGLQFQK